MKIISIGGLVMKKRFIALTLVVALLITALTGCKAEKPAPDSSGNAKNENNESNNDSTDTSEPTTLTVWAWDDNYNIPIMQLAGEYYAKENPNVSVEVISLAKEDVYTKMQTGLSAGGTGLPDIVLLEDYVSAKYLQTFKGSFADLTDKVDYSNFLPFKIDAVSNSGRAYGVPLDTGASILFYRTDLIQEAGYTDADMQDMTWEQFIEIGKAVKDKTGSYMIVEMAANKTTLLRSMMQSVGKWYFDSNGEISIVDNVALEKGFALIKDMKDAGILYEAEGTGDRAGVLNNGTVASIVNGPWMASTIKAATDQSGLWRIASTPRFSDVEGAVNASNLGGSSWYVFESSKNKDIAADLLNKVYANSTEYYEDIMLAHACVSGYIPALSGPAFETEDEYFGGQKIYQIFADTLAKVPGVNYGGYVAEANDAITAAFAGVLSGDTEIKAALEAADAQLKNQLGR
ncbi:MAG: extracellular solute-binding protein [Anaerolineaceae bacterium]|nr:MAG: extracellular solute-binding protein [Anaerolineaceae bacterium]